MLFYTIKHNEKQANFFEISDKIQKSLITPMMERLHRLNIKWISFWLIGMTDTENGQGHVNSRLTDLP